LEELRSEDEAERHARERDVLERLSVEDEDFVAGKRSEVGERVVRQRRG
jgi:hypothetical protein